jgi:ceramide glucosyltransferase
MALAFVAMIHGASAMFAVRLRLKPHRAVMGAAAAGTAPGTVPVTIMKPLCGPEPLLYECLRSFCDQDHPAFQIVFGVRDSHDPAVEVVRRLQREFPALELALAANAAQHGTSRKVSNLINMLPLARHETLVLADSDIRVGRDYLRRVVAPLQDPRVGVVTCAYRGAPQPGIWSLLGALFINEWFLPSVRLAALAGSRAFAFGATIALRRNVLAGIGGFHSVVNSLADDYRLGELTRRLGLSTVLSDVVVETSVNEASLGDLVRHELRWLRTIRAVQPFGYSLAFVTFGVPVAALGSALTACAKPALVMLGVTLVARIALHCVLRRRGSTVLHLWLLPVRDALGLVLWAWSFLTRTVHWRHDRFLVRRYGSAQAVCEDRVPAEYRARTNA